jgi:phage terminase small subunit
MKHRGRKHVYDFIQPPWTKDAAPKRPRVEPPAHLSEQMKFWWRTVSAEHDLKPHAFLLLEAAANAWDAMQSARLVIAEQGMSYLNKKGEPRPRPECAVLRDSLIAFGRVVRQLDLDPPTPPKVGGLGIMP